MRVATGAAGARAVWFSGLSRRPTRVVLTVLGIASGVALSFAVAAENASLTEGAAATYRQLAGRSTVELIGLGPNGLPLSVAQQVRHLPGVAAAAPISESTITVRRGGRSVDLRLFGMDSSAGALGGTLARNVPRVKRGGTIGLYLPRTVAHALRVGAEAEVIAYSRIGPTPTYVAQVLPDRRLGRLADTPVAFADLSLAELLTGGGDKVQRILVVPRGRPSGLVGSLERIGGPGSAVWSTAAEIHAVNQASSLSRESSSLFAALSLVVGGLLAYGAMVLVVAERRREVATLRVLGCATGALMLAVLLDALFMGLAGTALGLLVGRLVVSWLLPHNNNFLSSAFLLSSRTVVPLGVVAVSCIAGIVTVLLAVILPARALTNISPAEALEAQPDTIVVGTRIPPQFLLGLVAALGGSAAWLTMTGHGVLGLPLWVFAGLIAVPITLTWVVRTVHRLLPGPGGASRVGLAEIAAFPARAAAAAAVVMLAVSGLVIVNGAVANLEEGTASLAASSYPPGDLFVTAPARDQVFFTQPLQASVDARLVRLPFVSHLTSWRSAFLDWDGRRILAFAYTDGARGVRAGEFIEGNALQGATALSDDPGAMAVSRDLANALNLRIGSRMRVPTPAGPKRMRVAAIITNFGWTPGALAINQRSFAAWWGSDYVTAFQVGLRSHMSRAIASQRIRTALAGTGLTVVTSEQMRARATSSAQAQLTNLQRIGILIAIAGVFAVTAVTLAGMLARVRRVAALRTVGMSHGQLALALASEAGWVVGIGAVLGSIVGIVGHALVIRYLSSTFAMAVTFKPSTSQFAIVIVLSAVIVLAATLVALRWASRLPLSASLRDV
jgi:putative ABC transport system permease protein